MLVLDENLPADQRHWLRKRRIRVRCVGVDLAAFGDDDENLIPLLHRLPRPTDSRKSTARPAATKLSRSLTKRKGREGFRKGRKENPPPRSSAPTSAFSALRKSSWNWLSYCILTVGESPDTASKRPRYLHFPLHAFAPRAGNRK